MAFNSPIFLGNFKAFSNHARLLFLGFRIADFVLLSTDILVLPKWNSLGFFALLDAVVILFTAKYNQFIVNACYGTDSKKFMRL